MATQVVCDHPYRGGVCGERVEQPVTIKLDGREYSLDICAGHTQRIRELVETVGHRATRANGHRRLPTQRRRKVDTSDKAVRSWAQSQGLDVATAGRVPNALKEQYLAAQ